MAHSDAKICRSASGQPVPPYMFTAACNVSNGAVQALTNMAAAEWGPFGTTANTICPSALSTHAHDCFDANPEMAARILSQVAAGRFGDAHRDIGPVALLASEASGYITRSTLFADGGSHVNGVEWRPAVDD